MILSLRPDTPGRGAGGEGQLNLRAAWREARRVSSPEQTKTSKFANYAENGSI